MKLFGKNLDREVAIIAEIGVNHEGDIEAASRMLRLAAEAGADAVKFQSYTPSRFIAASDPVRFERVTRFGLNEAAHHRLADEAKSLGVHFVSTPVSEDWLPLLARLCGVIKIASGDLTFEPVIRAAARTGLPVVLSTGLGTIEEVDQAVAWVRDEVGAAALPEHLALMHCISAYPTPIEDANVLSVPFMAERYGVTVGFSNHIIGPEACWAAIAVGARIIEVHFTDGKNGRTFRDHELSMEQADLVELKRVAPLLAAARGRYGKDRAPSEAGNLLATRKGVVAAHDLPAGAVLTRDDLMWARPATEFAAAEIDTLVGCRLGQGLTQGQLIPRTAIER